MSYLSLKVVTPQRTVIDLADVEMVNAPGTEGEVGILPNHAPMLTRLNPGILSYTVGQTKHYVGIQGAFLEVSRNRVSVAADSAILPEEADQRRAQEARDNAQKDMEKRLEGTDFQKVEAELRKSLLELKLLKYAEG